MSEHGLSDVTVRKDLKGLSIRGFLTTQFKDGYTLEYIVSDGLLERLVVSCEQKLPHNQSVWYFFGSYKNGLSTNLKFCVSFKLTLAVF